MTGPQRVDPAISLSLFIYLFIYLSRAVAGPQRVDPASTRDDPPARLSLPRRLREQARGTP